MRDLMSTNVYDVSETLVIVGSCLERMQPNAFEELKKFSNDILDVCLEREHLNMVITKIMGMISRVNVKKIVFATVDKSPHCVQLHYVMKELEKGMDLSGIEIMDYVAVNDELVEIPMDVIGVSKNLSELNEKYKEIL